MEDVAGAVKDLIAAGKVKHFGLSEAGVAVDPPRACGAAGDGAAERILAVVARAGDGDPAAAARSSASASCRSARSARASSPARSTRTTKFDKNDFRNIVPRFSAGEPQGQPGPGRSARARSRRARRRRPRRSRSRGCWRRSPGSCRSPARPSCIAWRRTSARACSTLTRRRSREIETALARRQGAGRPLSRASASARRALTMTRVLILGANGQLARNTTRVAARRPT